MESGGWTRGPILGRGSTATVSLASDTISGDLFAVKSAELVDSSILIREQTILSSLDPSAHVISYLGHDSSDDRYNLFLEYAPGGSLHDQIVKNCGAAFDEPTIRSRTRDVVTGLAFLHSRNIAHCDIKSRNVLIGSDGRVKIADLGCAKPFSDRKSPVMGTPMFMAPEVARGEYQGPEADVWAIGCVVIEMATGRAPWPDASDAIAVLHRIAHSDHVPQSPEWMSDAAKDFLSKCLSRDPNRRWSADRLLTHPFLLDCVSLDPECRWTSPKSVLDGNIWESLETEEEDTCAEPRREIAELVGVSGPNWTWDEDWLAVRTGGDGDEKAEIQETEDAISTTVYGDADYFGDLFCSLKPVTMTDLFEFGLDSMKCNGVNYREQLINEKFSDFDLKLDLCTDSGWQSPSVLCSWMCSRLLCGASGNNGTSVEYLITFMSTFACAVCLAATWLGQLNSRIGLDGFAEPSHHCNQPHFNY